MDFKRRKVGDQVADEIQPVVDSSSEPASTAPAVDAPAELVFDDEPKKGSGAHVLARSRQLLNLYGGLLAGFLIFYALADYTAYTTAEQRPGQLIFSNTMNQLWTACFRLAFVLGASLGLLRLFWPELFQFFRPDNHDGPDLTNTIKYELTSFQRLCVFLLAFFGLCFLFIALLSVNLPQTVSVGR